MYFRLGSGVDLARLAQRVDRFIDKPKKPKRHCSKRKLCNKRKQKYSMNSKKNGPVHSSSWSWSKNREAMYPLAKR